MISTAVTSLTTDATGRGTALARVGMFPPFDPLERGAEPARAFPAQADDAGIDHACCADHVSFAGTGSDGLVQAAALTLLHPTLPVYSGVYLPPLRHPVLVARQLPDISRHRPQPGGDMLGRCSWPVLVRVGGAGPDVVLPGVRRA